MAAPDDDCGCSGVARYAGMQPMGLTASLQALHGGMPLVSTVAEWPALRTALLLTPLTVRRDAEIARLDTLYGVTS